MLVFVCLFVCLFVYLFVCCVLAVQSVAKELGMSVVNEDVNDRQVHAIAQ